MTLKINGNQNLLGKQTAALDSIMQFEKHFTSEYCGYGKVYHFLSPKIWIWETLLSVTFLRLCISISGYSSCMDIFAPDFQLNLKNATFCNEIFTVKPSQYPVAVHGSCGFHSCAMHVKEPSIPLTNTNRRCLLWCLWQLASDCNTS